MSKKKRAKVRVVQPLEASPAPVSAVSPVRRGQIKWPVLLAVADPLSILGLYIYLLAHSWLRWMDPMVDFPRDLYLAWRVSEGDLLYKTLANWYGPLAQLVEGSAFKLFGVGIDTIIWSNIALTAVVVILLRDLFQTLGNRLSGWLAAVVFLAVFAFGHYMANANYNFIAPYVAQSTYSFAGLVVVLWSLVHHLKSERSWWLGLTGLGLAVVYLDKPEASLAAGGSLAVYLIVRFIRAARAQAPMADWRAAGRWIIPVSGWLAGGFFSLWLPVFIYFGLRGGLRYAILATNYVPYSVLAFRQTVLTEHSQIGFSGFDQPWTHFAHQSLSGLALVLICGAMAAVARAWTRVPKNSKGWWLLSMVVVAIGGLGAWLADSQAKHWVEIGGAFVFPVVIAAIFTVVWSLRVAWTGRADWMRPLGLAVVGVAAALMMVRIFLNGRIYHFGFFMMPLAAIWLVHLMVVEAAQRALDGQRNNHLLPIAFTGLVLVGVYATAQTSLGVYAIKNFEVGEGRDHFYTYELKVFYNGQLLKDAMKAFKLATPQAKTLAVFPEGIAVNYHLRVRSSLAEVDFHPPALAYAGPAHVLAELNAHPPESIILLAQDFSEFGRPYFGTDEAGGRNVLLWINDHYWLAAVEGHGQEANISITHDVMDLVKPRTPGSTGITLLRDDNNAPLAPENVH